MGWSASWTLGLFVTLVSIAFHTAGVVMIAVALESYGMRRSRKPSLSSRHDVRLAIATVSGIGLLLAVLHGIEAAIWAGTYILIGALPTRSEAVLYSIDSLTTRGASGLTLEAHWRLMGAVEAADGMLLFGISTAFLFTVFDRIWTANFGGASAEHG